MAAWFSKKKDEDKKDDNQQNAADKQSTNSDENTDQASEMIIVTDAARDKLLELIGNAVSPVLGVRIIAEATSPVNPEYSLGFVQEGENYHDDTVVEFGDFNVYVDPESLEYVDGVQLDFITTGMGGGFRIEKPKAQMKLDGPLAEKIQKVIDDQINPALAMHGGNVSLIDVKESTAYIELGGGCRGCGMVDVTLKQGIEKMIMGAVPEITKILDTTDHASGSNPYYQPSK